LLVAGARLFASRGYHAVGVEEIGRALGLTGPALYRHFPSKQALLVAVFDRVIEHQLETVRRAREESLGPEDALAAVITAHVTFALEERELLGTWRQEFSALAAPDRGRLRRMQHLYVDEWVSVLTTIRPHLGDGEARAVVCAAIALLQSPNDYHSGLPPSALSALLTSMTMAVLLESDAAAHPTSGVPA
jgi:AcrR family transcriptional regulator